MAIGKSIRIYDLAREVKQDTKRVMEDLRREGADVSVASNSVPFEIAEKVRNKYFPKAEVAPKRAIKVIKAAAKPAEPAEAPAESEIPDETPQPTKVVATPVAPPEADAAVPSGPSSVKKLSKRAPVAEPTPEPVPEPDSTFRRGTVRDEER